MTIIIVIYIQRRKCTYCGGDIEDSLMMMTMTMKMTMTMAITMMMTMMMMTMIMRMCSKEEVHILRWRYWGQLHNSRHPRCHFPISSWYALDYNDHDDAGHDDQDDLDDSHDCLQKSILAAIFLFPVGMCPKVAKSQSQKRKENTQFSMYKCNLQMWKIQTWFNFPIKISTN